MLIVLSRLLLDFGLLVLIWIVQRIVYPGFLHVDGENLHRWHRIYTSRFTFIVLPLMLGQLCIVLYQFVLNINVYTISSLMIVLVLWLSTFFQFVPLHARISKGNSSQIILKLLVKKNWIRTFLWTFLFLQSLTYTLLSGIF